MPRRVLTQAETARIIGMLESGTSQSDVARHFAVHRSVINRAFHRYQTTGLCSALPRSGRPRATNHREDRFLALSARRQRFVTARTLQTQLFAATGTHISDQTVRNRLHQDGLAARRPLARIPLTPRHRNARLQWAQRYRHWTHQQWRNVMFSDESRFCLDVNDGRQRVWRRRGERYADCTVSQHDRYGGGSVMVWAGIWVGGRTDLVVFRQGTLTGVRYVNEVIRPQVIPTARQLGQGFIFMDDNAPCHRARVVQNELRNNNIYHLPWPAKSPDLNPIEHAWDMLGRAVRTGPAPPQTLDALAAALVAHWRAIPQADLDRLIASVPARVQACIHAGGGHTRY